MTMQVDKARLDEMPDLIERLEKGVVCLGLDDDNNTEWFDIDDANDSMFEAAQMLRSIRFTDGKEGAKTLAYLIDCPVEPCLEFADVDVPDAAIPLVRRSDLEAAEAGHKAARENFLTMQGSAAQLLGRAEAAEAHVAKLREALTRWYDEFSKAFITQVSEGEPREYFIKVKFKTLTGLHSAYGSMASLAALTGSPE